MVACHMDDHINVIFASFGNGLAGSHIGSTATRCPMGCWSLGVTTRCEICLWPLPGAVQCAATVLFCQLLCRRKPVDRLGYPESGETIHSTFHSRIRHSTIITGPDAIPEPPQQHGDVDFGHLYASAPTFPVSPCLRSCDNTAN